MKLERGARQRAESVSMTKECEGRSLEWQAEQLGTKIGFDARLFGRFWNFQRLCFGGEFCSSRNSRVFRPAFLVPFSWGRGGEGGGGLVGFVDCY